MSVRFRASIAVLITVVAGSASVAQAWPKSRLAELAARQDLSDQVCIALSMDNGRITNEHRGDILADAQKILDPKEFQHFHQALDRLSPPLPKKPVVKRPDQTAQRNPLALTRLQAMKLSSRTPVQKSEPAAGPATEAAPQMASEPADDKALPPAPLPDEGPVMPTSATEPDRVASPAAVR